MRRKLIKFFSVVVFILIILLLVVIPLYVFSNPTIEDVKEDFSSVIEKFDPNNEDTENSNINSNTNVSPVVPSGAGGAGSSESSGGTESGSDCFEIQISYSLEDVTYEEECTAFSGEECINKESSCSVKLVNFDKDFGGIFGIELVFFEVENRENVFGSFLTNYIISPQQNSVISNSLSLVGSDANKNVSCLAKTSNVPKKLVC